MQQSQLIDRLAALRTSIRRRLVAYGICVVLAGGVAALLAIFVLDWLLWLPPLLRIVVAGLFLTGFVGATFHWIVRPLQAGLRLDEVAARLEERFGSLQDRLISSVDFIQRGDAGSESMMQQVVRNTERVIQAVPLESALSLRPLILRGVLLAVSLSLLIGLVLGSPDWARTGFYRYVYPWDEIEWPRTVAIRPLTSDQIVAVGESVTVGMAVDRGLTSALRGVVHVREPDGTTMALAMQRDQQDTFYTTIDAVTQTIVYWFEAGDDNTEDNPSKIQAVPRPEVVSAFALVEPPPYAPDRPVRVQDLRAGPVRAPIGGHVRVEVRASKPIPVAPGRVRPQSTSVRVGLRTETGELIPLIVDPKDHHKLSARFEITSDLNFRVELRDQHGIENRGAVRYAILATPDQPPTVAILEPAALIELTPRGSLPLRIRAEDDFGLTALDLEVEHRVVRLRRIYHRVEDMPTQDRGHGTRETFRVPLTNRLETVRNDNGIEAMARYSWDVTPLSLLSGDVLVYRAVATDNRPSPDGHGQVTRSSPMRIKIISEIEFEIRLRSDIALLTARIRQVALNQADLLDRTAALQSQTQVPTGLTRLRRAQREAAAGLATEQARMARRLHTIAGRFHKLERRMKQNHIADQEARSRIASLGFRLQQTATGPMTAASRRLSEAREHVEAVRQHDDLREASTSQEAAIDQLHAILRSVSQWGSFHELVTKTQDLLDRQNTLRTRTAELGRSMLGKPVTSLTETEATALRRMGRQQDQLAVDVEQLLARMKQLATATVEQSGSPAADSKPLPRPVSEAIDAALRTARGHEVTRHLRTATEAIKANRTAAATISQKLATDAMRQMVTALRESAAANRELEELRKRLQRAQDQVAMLIEQQQALRAATHETEIIGADDRQWSALERQQHTLMRNTRLLGEQLAEVERNAPVARLVSAAGGPMGEAEAYLREERGAPATLAQEEALTLLREALTRLEQAARETAEEALRRSLAQIREVLEAILAAQQNVNKGIGKLIDAIAARGRIGRLEARAASGLAREQAEVRAMVSKQVRDFEKVVVYHWALQRVAQWMAESRNRLSDRKIDDDLVSRTNRIVRELEKLIGAIVETESLPVDTQFVESDRSGGGNGGETAQSKPVPTVAELLVLKAMQSDVNERTRTLHKSLDVDNATEEQLGELKMLGEDQAEVRRLTEMVTNRVRQP